MTSHAFVSPPARRVMRTAALLSALLLAPDPRPQASASSGCKATTMNMASQDAHAEQFSLTRCPVMSVLFVLDPAA